MSLAWIVTALVFYVAGIAVMQHAQRLARGRSRTIRLMVVVGLYLGGIVFSALWVAGADRVTAWLQITVLVILAFATATLAWATSVLVRSLRASVDRTNGMAP